MTNIVDVITEKVDVVGIYITPFSFFTLDIKYKCHNLPKREAKFNALLIN